MDIQKQVALPKQSKKIYLPKRFQNEKTTGFRYTRSVRTEPPEPPEWVASQAAQASKVVTEVVVVYVVGDPRDGGTGYTSTGSSWTKQNYQLQ